MSTNPNPTSAPGGTPLIVRSLPGRAWLVRLGLILPLLLGAGAGRAADNNPAELMTYQGTLTDQNGVVLGLSAPVNYAAVFRIYDHSSAGVLLWAESQVITVDKGLFSVQLGQGSAHGSEPRPPLSTVLSPNGVSAWASDRFIALNVTLGGVATDILPRLRLVPSAFAFLARNANNLLDSNGAAVVTTAPGMVGINKTPTTALDVNGTVKATSFSGSGAGLSGLDGSKLATGTIDAARIPGLDAGKITTGTFDATRIPGLDGSKITAGTLSADRIPGLDAGKITSGTFGPGRLEGVAVLQGGNAFGGGNHIFVGGGMAIGHFAPTTRLHIKQAFDSGGTNPNNDGLNLEAASGNKWIIQTQGGGDLVFDYNGKAAYAWLGKDSVWHNLSDARVKKDVVPMDHMLERVRQLRAVTFRYQSQPEDSRPLVGFVAQEVQPVFPEAVEDKEGTLSIGYAAFGPIAIGAIRELADKVDDLKSAEGRIAELEKKAARVDVLEREVAELRRMMTQIMAPAAERQAVTRAATESAIAGR